MFFLLALLPSVSAQLNKTYLYPNGLGSSFEYNSSLPTHDSVIVALDTVPDQCLAYAENGGSPYCTSNNDMSAYNVTYDDCSLAWTMCYCNETGVMPFDTWIEYFGRAPVNLRDYVRYSVAFPGTLSAFSDSQDFVLFGDASGEDHLSVFIHEMGHDIDQGVSSSAEWLDAIDADTCVPDAYAATNNVEDFAQTNVVLLFLDLFGYWPEGNITDASCMSNQIAVFTNNSRLNAAAMSLATCDLSIRSQFNQPPTSTENDRILVASDTKFPIPSPLPTVAALTGK